jgi:ABC-type nitrate/sulfonate/bicarbonate transport system substrate-binding protein
MGSILSAAFMMNCSELQAQSKQIVTIACCSGDAYAPYLHALNTGKVSSQTVDVQVVALPLPAYLQALGTKQYDLLETSALTLPLAVERGLDVVIVGSGGIVHGGRYLLVKSGSRYKTVDDLKGQTIGVSGLGTNATAHLRAVLARKNFAVSLENGSVQWVDLPSNTLPIAVSRDQISSAFIFHTPALKSLQSGDFQSILDVAKEYRTLFGSEPLTSVIVSYKSVMTSKGPAIREALRLLRSSAEYAQTHKDEVYGAVAAQSQLSVEDLKKVASEWYEVNFKLDVGDIKMIQSTWDIGRDVGMIKSFPPLDTLLLK